ncbi:MAG: hypothetical protein ACRDYZ_11830 [Acidimicrobiales bacterium]
MPARTVDGADGTTAEGGGTCDRRRLADIELGELPIFEPGLDDLVHRERDPDERTVADLDEEVLAATGSSSPVEHLPLPADDPTRRCPDTALARRMLGWEPCTALADGLAPTVEYFAGVGVPRSG